METSYFAKYRGVKGVSIALSSVPGFEGPTYPALQPKWSFVSQYKRSIDSGGCAGEAQRIYTINYTSQVLAQLDPFEVYTDLQSDVLLCWEKTGKFCHRRIVARWIAEHTGLIVKEAA